MALRYAMHGLSLFIAYTDGHIDPSSHALMHPLSLPPETKVSHESLDYSSRVSIL